MLKPYRLSRDLVVLAMVAFVVVVGAYMWEQYDSYSLFGFDTGIFSQGTWLLAHFHNPFVTIRGLNLFGDHSSYILILVAPLYRLFPDPRTLLMIQTLALAFPAWAIFKVGTKRAGLATGVVVSVAYLIFPAMTWASTWEFHCETIAAGFLAGAVLAYEFDHRKWMIACLALALLCKEDVSLVVAGFGVVVLLDGRKKLAAFIIGAAVIYFVLVTLVITPLIVGYSNLYFQRNYGINHGQAVSSLPHLEDNAIIHAFDTQGLLYLAQIFAPMALISLLGRKYLIPIVGPLVLNLASAVGYQRSIHYQYLATSAPFVAFAAIDGVAFLKRAGEKTRHVLPVLAVMAIILAASQGPYSSAYHNVRADNKYNDALRNDAIAMIPKNASVAATYNIDTHLSSRTNIYEFPNPFVGANWGLGGDPSQARANSVQYVIIDTELTGDDDWKVINGLKTSGQWQPIYNEGNFFVIKRTASAGS